MLSFESCWMLTYVECWLCWVLTHVECWLMLSVDSCWILTYVVLCWVLTYVKCWFMLSVDSCWVLTHVEYWLILSQTWVNKSTVILTHKCGGMGLDWALSTNQRCIRHPYRFFSSYEHCQQINAHFHTHIWGYEFGWVLSTNQRWSQRHPSQIFLLQNTLSTNQRSFSHTRLGVWVQMGFVNNSTVNLNDTPPRFFASNERCQQINAHFHTHIWR